MAWFFIALLAPFFFAVSNFIDKYLIERYFKHSGTGALMLFSSLIGIVVMPFFYWLYPDVLNIAPRDAIFLAMNGMLFLASLVPYLYALRISDTSTVVPIFQSIPLFALVLGYVFLGEVVTITQLIGVFLVVAGGVGISLELREKKIRFQGAALALMVLSSLLIACNGLIFKYITLQNNFFVASFWTYAGYAVMGVVLFCCVTSYRMQFIHVYRTNSFGVLALNALNETISVIAKVIYDYAIILVPLVLAATVNGFQPIFSFLIGAGLSFFFPHVIREKITHGAMVQKLFCIILVVVGAFLITR